MTALPIEGDTVGSLRFCAYVNTNGMEQVTFISTKGKDSSAGNFPGDTKPTSRYAEAGAAKALLD
jgi:hypothetical protein